MKKIILLFILVSTISLAQTTTTPSPAVASGLVTINFNKSGTPLAAYTGTIYAHIGLTVNGVRWQYVKGSWGNNTTQPALTFVSGTTYKLDLTPDLFTSFGVTAGSSITEICVVFRDDKSSGNIQSADTFLNVGAFQSVLGQPVSDSNTIITSGQNFTVSATNTNGNANYNLLANGVSINTATTASYSFTDTNVTANKSYELQITQGVDSFVYKFTVMINPVTISEALPANVEEGINYNPTDATKATLVLDAPGKDFVYVAGSFNNWLPGISYAMKKDPTTGKFWLELSGLVSGTNYNYQYWVVDTTPLAGSPGLVKTADPYSTLVLSPFDDPTIPSTSYPNIPVYPVGQEREVTVLKTGQAAYNWQVTNFNKPKKEDLIVYEVLIRDFDANRNFQSLIDRISYFKNLNINAIELMPIMEFEGNESWGYNTAFHMALDKFYGTSDKLKELVDLCHQNGIAVILDVALNHAFGRNPMVRMWMKDPDGDGWGDASSENPYFNEFAKHSYSVGNDFNHSATVTKTYVKRVIKQWIQEYKIDGFRWDLTKGFTQLCSAGDDACTNGSPSDRVPILKDYADYSWSLDPTHYAIFEHLGSDSEEQQWANYRIGETPSKGVMMWGEMTYPYSQLIEGWATGGDISRIGSDAHGFTAKRLMGYPESHDKERLMYSAMTYGNPNVLTPLNNLNNSLARMSAIGAASLLVPGPKMIWHFADLGMQNSIYDCNNGTVNTETDLTAGDCKLNTKPQPQWTDNWLGVSQRLKIYNDWSKMIALKIQEPIFEGSYVISPDANNVKQRIYIYDNSLLSSQLKNVVVLCNFSVASLTIVPSFPYTGTWYNLMDNTSINVTDVSVPLTIPSGQFLIYGNQKSTLGTTNYEFIEEIHLYPNPSSNYFTLNTNSSKLEIYSMTGQLVKSFNSEQSKGYQYTISDLAKGMYFVRTLNDNNEVKVLKFIKQ
ncbi:MAG: alpha-amylase family glycosyl hydrolase [Flavobacterium sp.]|uniref:alpha-amylase family glycosyl hydrolase n=1 Tax=Flavobacterium sp. TaxID=239 RepID=UPI002611C02F|nr:alpha-amylase family glycosyl hydrolase [Flavobacterium sp.]MDD5149934.1 alpha-amylase family glycosyl hydrolase [Flavobacterium sp.]